MSEQENPNQPEEKTNPANLDRYTFDTYLIKQFLEKIKEGNIESIQNYIDDYSLDIKFIREGNLQQNALFYTQHVKGDLETLDLIKFLVNQGIEANSTDKLKQTILYYTARDGKLKCCEYLIENGCPLNDLDIYMQTPLFYAAREGRLAICQFFVEKGADVNQGDNNYQTALFYAVKEGKLDVIKYLISQGADFNKIDKKKQNLLYHANKTGRSDVYDLLISAGAEPLAQVQNKKSKKLKQIDKSETKEYIPEPKKYILIRITEDNQKIAMSEEEVKIFLDENEDLNELLKNREKLALLEKELPNKVREVEVWEKQAKKLMNSLWKHKDSHIFYKPVDPVEFGIHDYFDIVQQPMDFSTIKRKLNYGIYANCDECIEDLDLVFYNCFLYNGEKSVIGQLCANVKEEYNKLFEDYELNQFKKLKK